MYRHTPDMGEISGMGGGYEEACQDMLEAGCKWLMEHGDTKLDGHSFTGVFGLMIADSDDAKAMEAVVLAACEDCTGAMHHAVMGRLFWIAKNGWDKYCDELRKKVADRQVKKT